MSRVFAPLTAQGLSLHAVLDLASLPADVQASLALTPQERARYRQLILIGHQGRGFWQALQARGWHGSDPVDTFVGECIQAWMNGPLAGHAWVQVFPGPRPVGLQRLGELAGWHHPSPFWVGVDAEWGSWFAYRAVVLADTVLPLTPRRALPSPCLDCSGQPCVAACPAQALSPIGAQGVDTRPPAAAGLRACVEYRLQPGSVCQDRCLARTACPVGAVHRYDDPQVAYHYLQSLPAIRAWKANAP